MARLLTVLVVCLAGTPAHAIGWPDFLLTADQQAQRLYDQGEYRDAAVRFTQTQRIGSAFYRAGDFAQAAAVFGRSVTPEAAFNRGNSLVMLGDYAGAIESYQRALERRPDWLAAAENMQLARLRMERLAPPDDDHGGTGGRLEADEIKFDTTGRVDKSAEEQTVETETGEMNDEALRRLWLKRVDTRPGDFLRVRFEYQLAKQKQQPIGDNSVDELQ